MGDSKLFQFFYLLFVDIFKESGQIKDKVFVFFFQPPNGIKEFFYSFFFHDSSEIQKMDTAVIRVRFHFVFFQVNSRTGQNNLTICRYDVSFAKFAGVFFIFKKDIFYFSESDSIQYRNKSGQYWFLECSSKSLYVGIIGNLFATAEQTHIDIWFNGLCKHKVRADFLQKPLIVPQQLCLGKRIHATSVHGYGNTLDSHFPKIFFMPDKWHGKNHFMLFLQGFHQFFAKLPEHIRMIGYN